MSQQHTSATPTILTAFKAWADTAVAAADTVVSVGPTVGTGDAEMPKFLFIGVEDPQSNAAAASSASNQDPATMGPPRSRDHTGTITCAIATWNGGVVNDSTIDHSAALMQAITDAYGVLALVENQLRSSPDLGLTGSVFAFLVVQVDNERLFTDQTDAGSSAVLVFDLKFRSRI